MAVRLSTLAEVKTLSISSILYGGLRADKITGENITSKSVKDALDNLKSKLAQGPQALQSNRGGIFTTVGLARQLRIDEDWGTQNIYGIGAPTKPRIVPNNYSVNVTAERIQLDTRELAHYITTPDYWYADVVQQQIGINDMLLYTYLFVKSKEATAANRFDIYAVMPRSSSEAVTSGDVMIANNVNLIGFKYSYEEFLFDTTNMINESITNTVVLHSRSTALA